MASASSICAFNFEEHLLQRQSSANAKARESGPHVLGPGREERELRAAHRVAERAAEDISTRPYGVTVSIGAAA